MSGEVEIEPRSADASQALVAALAIPQRLQRRTGTHALVVFDEFQDLLKVGSRVDGLMRSVIQHHENDAAYVFAGSHPGLMNELFASRAKPLYGQARAVSLRPFGDSELSTYLRSRFESADRPIQSVLAQMVALVRGHPQRAMMFAHHLWEATGEASDDESAFELALASVFEELRDAFRLLWRELPSTHTAALEAIARQEAPVDTNIAQELESRGDVVNMPSSDGGNWTIVDPFLEAWILNGDSLVLHGSPAADLVAFPTGTGPETSLLRTRRGAIAQIESLRPGARVLLPTAANAPIRSGVGTIIGIQPPLAPFLGESMFFVRLDSGRITTVSRSTLRMAGAADFGRFLLGLLSANNEPDSALPSPPSGLDSDYARELLDLVTVTRNLAQRAVEQGLSQAEEQFLRELITVLSTEISKMTGRRRGEVRSRITMSLPR